jgi:hypothetical protein
MSQPIFNQVILDPTLIAGVYNTCDQWCMYCPVTARCLAYRCSPEIAAGNQDIFQSLAARLREGMTFVRKRSEAAGTPTPELDTILSDDARTATAPPIDDPLERAGARYARLAHAYLLSRADYPFELVWRPTGPTPLEVLAWFHMRIGIKIYRALYCSAMAARGEEWMRADALASAKVALIGIDRSLDALTVLSVGDDDPRMELLCGHLRRMRREVEGRYPDARGVVREGLD